MLRKGLLALLVVGLAACTESVDDPADFTAGNSAAASSSSSTAATDGPGNSTGVADNGNDGTTSGADGTTSGVVETTTGAATDSGGNTGNCGNGAIDAGEQCDGADLQGFDCASLGLSGGTLACDPVMCTFDTSMCSAGPGTSG